MFNVQNLKNYSCRWIMECVSEILVSKYFFNGLNKENHFKHTWFLLIMYGFWLFLFICICFSLHNIWVNELNYQTSANRKGVGIRRLSGGKSTSDCFLDGCPSNHTIVFVDKRICKAAANFSIESSGPFGTFNCVKCWW